MSKGTGWLEDRTDLEKEMRKVKERLDHIENTLSSISKGLKELYSKFEDMEIKITERDYRERN